MPFNSELGIHRNGEGREEEEEGVVVVVVVGAIGRDSGSSK